MELGKRDVFTDEIDKEFFVDYYRIHTTLFEDLNFFNDFRSLFFFPKHIADGQLQHRFSFICNTLQESNSKRKTERRIIRSRYGTALLQAFSKKIYVSDISSTNINWFNSLKIMQISQITPCQRSPAACAELTCAEPIATRWLYLRWYSTPPSLRCQSPRNPECP